MTKWTETPYATDADMIVRKPLSVYEGLPAREGEVAAGYYGYLVGVDNEMATMFVPKHVVPILAKVGGWEIFWADDLRKAAPLWFEYTKKVRQDPRAHFPFMGSGDAFITKARGSASWIHWYRSTRGLKTCLHSNARKTECHHENFLPNILPLKYTTCTTITRPHTRADVQTKTARGTRGQHIFSTCFERRGHRASTSIRLE